MAVLTTSDAEWLKGNYPTLTVNEDFTEVHGEINFAATYDKSLDNFSIIRSNSDIPPGLVLHGVYNILIKDLVDMEGKPRWLLPRLYIQNPDFEFSLDRHFTGKSACLSGPSEEVHFLSAGYLFPKYLEELCVPFLYAQTYYDLHKKWPWAEYEHDILGILQSYLTAGDPSTIQFTVLVFLNKSKDWPQIRTILKDKESPKGHMLCYCGSGDYIRRCHPDVWEGLKKLRADIQHLKIELPD